MKPTAETQCAWWPDHEGLNTWQSQCGLLWGLANDASPKENQMNYCPKCGKELVEELEENGKD